MFANVASRTSYLMITLDTRLERQIIRLSVFSFMGPPIGWFFILLVGEIITLQDALSIMLNPFFFAYIAVFMGTSVWMQLRLFALCRRWTQAEDWDALNLLIRRIPMYYLVFTAVYGFFGPPTVMIGLDIPSNVYLTAWILGPVVISTFAIPFFNTYLNRVYQYVSHVPLDYSRYFSIQRRMVVSIAYLVIGVLIMISIVFYHVFMGHIQGNEISTDQLLSKIAIFLLLGVLIVTVPMFLLVRELRSSLIEVVDFLKNFRQGHLGHCLNTTYRDEFGLLMSDASRLSTHFNKVIGQMKDQAQAIRSIGHSVQEASNDIANEGARQLERSLSIGDDLKQILTNVSSNTQQADQLNDSATFMKGELTEGEQDMTALNARLQVISDRLTALTEITQQTDLLAINAAVEASNAGVYGQGFRVVATEVRKLAERSRALAEEIGGLSTEIVALADVSTRKFTSFSSSLVENSLICSHIQNASLEQKQLTEKIDANMDSFSEEMKRLNALSDAMNEQARSMHEITAELDRQTGHFHTI